MRHKAFVIEGGDLSEILEHLTGGSRQRRRPRSIADLLLGDGGGIGLEDLLEALRPRSPVEMAEDVDRAINNEEILKLQPTTNRSRIQTCGRCHLSWTGGFQADAPAPQSPDPPSEETRPLAALVNLPKHSSRQIAFHIKGTADPEEAVRRANLLLDIGLGLVEDAEMSKSWLRTREAGRRPHRRAHPAESGAGSGGESRTNARIAERNTADQINAGDLANVQIRNGPDSER
jgi:hypothetical protein